PVSLASFITIPGDGLVTLKWVTESETDNDAFILERGTDMKNFHFLAEINGSGTTNERTTYTYTDELVSNGITYYYRLSDRDYNGNVTHLAIISATPNSTGVDVDQRNPISYRFQLHSNYPNPFNPETAIRFEVPVLSDGINQVTLKVYNSLGQFVKTLYDGPLAGGVYEIKWDGKDELGNPQPSGVYMVHLSSGHLSKTRKMILIR
ncbi:MAG: T9SS C-terminal target domain-containing protein, partial [Methanobacteriota archaeon]